MKPIFKIIGRSVKMFVVTAIRSFPVGNAIFKGAEAVKGGGIRPAEVDGEIKEVQVKDPYIWHKVVIDAVVGIALLYLLYTKQISIDHLVDYLHGQ